MAGLWAYARTRGGEVSKRPGSPVADIAVRIGRAVTGVYTKVMNFRAIDPTDDREGMSGGGEADRLVWKRYFNEHTRALDVARLDADFERTWDGTAHANGATPSFVEKPETTRTIQGQGFERDPKIRAAVEQRAMDLAAKHYEDQGFTVENTATRFPYDLRCKRGDLEVRVEVKGTRGDGSSIELTVGELNNARGSPWRTDLFLVRSIEVQAGTPPAAVGGTVEIMEGWNPQEEDLAPTTYRWTRRAQASSGQSS
jgi:hypothetical protein